MATVPNFDFPPLSPDEVWHNKREELRAGLKHLLPKKREDVSQVAMALKSGGGIYEDVFLQWAKPFGRQKAKQIWNNVRPDPDAIDDVIEWQHGGKERKERFKLQTVAEVAKMQSQQWRIKGVFPRVGIAAIYGPSKSGKSFKAFDMAAAIGEGSPFFGHATKPGVVLYIALEGEAGMRGRALAWERHNGRPMPNSVRFMLQPFRLTDPQDVSDLAETIIEAEGHGAVVFIDTLNRAAPEADENSSKDMGRIIEGAKTLQRLIGGLVVLIAHTGKDGSKGLRGHSSLFAALDAAILVERNGDSRSWKVDKAKDGKDGEEHRFRLRAVEIGIDEDGESITSCVVEPDYMPTLPVRERALTKGQQFGLETFSEAAGMYGGLNERGDFIGLHVNKWREVFYRKSTADNDGSKRKAFNRARDELVEIGRLTVSDNIYRLAGSFAAIEEVAIAKVCKAAGHETKAGQGRDMSRVATLPLAGQTGHVSLDMSHVPAVRWPVDTAIDKGKSNEH